MADDVSARSTLTVGDRKLEIHRLDALQERWDVAREYDRLGLDDNFLEILGLRIPQIKMPVAPGRNIAILVEVAARNQLLRARGHHAARLLSARLDESLRRSAVPADRQDEEDDEFSGGGQP